MGKGAVALFTFFSRTTCGHCKHFKGESTDAQGRSKIDPNSGWEVLTADRELQDMGVEFQLYQFGPEKDPETGVVKNYALDEEYAKRVKGIPHLEMSVPDDPHNYVQFNDPELRGWDAPQSVPVIKKWIIRTLQQEPFKSWRPKAKVARPPEAIMPNRNNQPLAAVQASHKPAVHQVPQIVKTNFQPTPTQQALIDRHTRQPAVAQKAATISRPQHGVHHPVVQHVQVATAHQPEDEEIDSLQEDEANDDSEKDEQLESEDKNDVESEEEMEHVKEQVIQQQRAIPVQNPRQPVRRQMAPVRTPQQVVRTPPQQTTTKGLATQRVQTPSPRPTVQVQAPVAVQAPAPQQPAVAAPPQQSKPKFLPSNWDV
jgi:hypothetical protein